MEEYPQYFNIMETLITEHHLYVVPSPNLESGKLLWEYVILLETFNDDIVVIKGHSDVYETYFDAIEFGCEEAMKMIKDRL